MFGVPATWIFASSKANDGRAGAKPMVKNKRKILREYLGLGLSFIKSSVVANYWSHLFVERLDHCWMTWAGIGNNVYCLAQRPSNSLANFTDVSNCETVDSIELGRLLDRVHGPTI